MKPLPILLALSLLSSPAWACESYEECMTHASATRGADDCADMNGMETCAQLSQHQLSKAIAYKLEEISKQLGMIHHGQEAERMGAVPIYGFKGLERPLSKPELKTVTLECNDPGQVGCDTQ